jgi:photosynthetic reaction center H subunit
MNPAINIDVAQVAIYLFWFFFAALVFYLRREDHREGYPLRNEKGERLTGFPAPPPAKLFTHQRHDS